LLDQRKTQKLWKLAFSIIEAICAEEDAQKTYWSFVKETNAPIDTKNSASINKFQSKTKEKTDLGQTVNSPLRRRVPQLGVHAKEEVEEQTVVV
jgi:hypothetical protein